MPDHRRTNRPDTAPITRPRRFPRDESRKALVDTVVPLSRQDIMRNMKIASIIAFVVSLAIVLAAERDLQHRSDAEVRGDRRLWRLVCLNALGALAYFRWGRRPASG